jgi:hypothetical protein
VVTPDGNLSRLRFGGGEVVNTVARTVHPVANTGWTMNFELTDGTMLVNVPNHAIRWEGYTDKVGTN